MLCLSDYVDAVKYLSESDRYLQGIVAHAHSINREWFEADYDVVTVSSESWSEYEDKFDVVESVFVELDEDCFQVFNCDATGKTMFNGDVVVAIVNKKPTIEITWDGRFVRATGFPVVE